MPIVPMEVPEIGYFRYVLVYEIAEMIDAAAKGPTEFYARHKHHIPSLTGDEAKLLRFAGAGTETFLVEALRSISRQATASFRSAR